MISESEHVASDGYEPENKQHWRRLTLAVLACIVGSSLLFGSSGKASLLNSSSAQATLGLAEEDECGCQSKKNEAESKCPPACIPFTGGCGNPLAHGTCITKAKVNEKICFADCAKNKVQQAAKDSLDSAQEAAKDAAKGATDSVNSVVNKAKDHVQSAKDSVGSASEKAKDTLASVSDEIKSRGKCIAALKPCITKCGIDVPSEGKDGTTESELQNIDTKDLTNSAKKCMKTCYDVYEDCMPKDEQE